MNFIPWWLPRLVLALYLYGGTAQRASASSPSPLQQAFTAAFGHAAPETRRHTFPDGTIVPYRLAPLALVHMRGPRFALIATESFDGAHELTGAAAVAYLDQREGAWRVDKIWYEVLQAGSFGTPFVDDMQFHFGGPPIFAGVSQFCGMGACTAWYNLIGLLPDRPVNWGTLHDQGQLRPIDDNLPDGQDGLTGCGGYAYSSFISPPLGKADMMKVTYNGWMLPGGGGQKRRAIHGSTEISVVDGQLKLRPEVPIPNCGQ